MSLRSNVQNSCSVAIAGLMAMQSLSAQQLPEGNNGIAAKYAGDIGIANDPSVILADNFEEYGNKSDLRKTWNSVFNQTELTRQKENVYRGKQAIEFSVPGDRVMASGIARFLVDEEEHQDVVFLRYYSKFASTYDVMGGAHTGGGISANTYNERGQSSAGTKSNGTNHYTIMLDHGRWKDFGGVANPGYLGIYIYHLGQRHQWGDGFFPTGMVIPNSSQKADFGPNFVSRPNIVTPLDAWHCHEVMLKANTPGKSNGRVAGWVDGKLSMDFGNLRFRDVESLKIDHLQIGLNINTKKHPATKKWYDNVVAATSYIGPVYQTTNESPHASASVPKALADKNGGEKDSKASDRSISKITAMLNNASNSEKWQPESIEYAKALWEDLAQTHQEGSERLVGRKIAGYEIDIESYDDYLGTYSKPQFKLVRDQGRLLVHYMTRVIPAIGTGKMIVFTTGELVKSHLPQLAAKPYADLEMYCIARVKGQFYFFRPSETPTEYHRIKHQSQE